MALLENHFKPDILIVLVADLGLLFFLLQLLKLFFVQIVSLDSEPDRQLIN